MELVKSLLRADGAVDPAICEKMSNRWCEEQNRCQRESERHQDADKSYLDEGVALLDLVRNARRLFTMQEPREERRLLNVSLSNCAWEDGEVVATFRQPLDMLAETETTTTRLEAGENARSAKSEIWLPDLYDYLEAEGYKDTIRLKANAVLQGHIAHLLKRPVGRPPMHVQRFHASFGYQAGSWSRKRRVVAKVEWHPGELPPRVGFIVTTLARPANCIVAFENQRGTAEQWIKEGKNAVKWSRLSCSAMKTNAVRLQLHAVAYNLSNVLRTLALPEDMESWSLTTIREKVVKIGAKVIAHARYAVLQMAELAMPRDLFRRILDMIDDLRPREPTSC